MPVNSNLSIMYASCYTFKSLWLPFLKLKDKYLDTSIPTYFCTDEIKDVVINKVNLLNYGHKSVFSLNGNYFDRHLFYANNISTDYILYFYDDMFPLASVDTDTLNKLINIMDNDNNIKIIKLSTFSEPFTNGIHVELNGIKFIRANNKLDKHLMNVQPIIIRRDFFIDMLNYCKMNNNITHQNGAMEIYGTNYFRENNEFICLRVIEDIIKINDSGGIVRSGIISEATQAYLKEQEDIIIETFGNNLIFKLTKDEYDALGDRVKDELRWKNIRICN